MLIGAAVLIPLTGWLAPRQLASLMAIVGVLCLPAVRIADEDRPAALILFAALIWAAVSTMWSPYHPSKPGNSTILKLAYAYEQATHHRRPPATTPALSTSAKVGK